MLSVPNITFMSLSKCCVVHPYKMNLLFHSQTHNQEAQAQQFLFIANMILLAKFLYCATDPERDIFFFNTLW
jgi:hypothetical protein